jgi:hypothetical protein
MARTKAVAVAGPAARFLVLFAALALFGSLAPAEAQYFGRNKVQYGTFDFEELQTEHFEENN